MKPEDATPYDLLVKAMNYTLTRKTNVPFNDRGNVVFEIMEQVLNFKPVGSPEWNAFAERAKKLMRSKTKLPGLTNTTRRRMEQKIDQVPLHPEVVEFTKRVIVADMLKIVAGSGPEGISKFLEHFRTKLAERK